MTTGKFLVPYRIDEDDFMSSLIFSSLSDGRWRLNFIVGDLSGEIIDFDCLGAFNVMRSRLGEKHMFLCNGARPNFILSPMLSHSGGLSGYCVPFGRLARMSDIVPTFAYAAIDDIGTVEDQSKFRDNYFKIVNSAGS